MSTLILYFWLQLSAVLRFYFFFFFQAEDGIRDKLVTGVQTCALPIYLLARIAQLPYRHLAGAEATPSVYRGVTGEGASADGTRFQLVGGVQLELRERADSERTYADRTGARLESLVDAGEASANVAQRVSLAFGLP